MANQTWMSSCLQDFTRQEIDTDSAIYSMKYNLLIGRNRAESWEKKIRQRDCLLWSSPSVRDYKSSMKVFLLVAHAHRDPIQGKVT
jgi:hypothetical protein